MTKQEIETRLEAITDITSASVAAGIHQPNVELLKKNIADSLDEAALISLEAEEATLVAAKTASVYSETRAVEFAAIDSLLSEALVEKELGDSTKWDAYIILRNAIKAAHPKPA